MTKLFFYIFTTRLQGFDITKSRKLLARLQIVYFVFDKDGVDGKDEAYKRNALEMRHDGTIIYVSYSLGKPFK
jgi:hypothetical protein